MSQNLDYATWWCRIAQEELKRKPDSTLYHLVTENISGGKSGWEPEIETIFLFPQGLEESLVRLTVRDILRQSLYNSIREAERRMREDGAAPPCTAWKGMDIGFSFSLAEKVASFDPLAAVFAKRELDRLSRLLGESLFSMANQAHGIYMVPDVGIHW